jgi:hypothetical protein
MIVRQDEESILLNSVDQEATMMDDCNEAFRSAV